MISSRLKQWQVDPDNMHTAINFAVTFDTWQYAGIINILLVGIRLYHFMKYHGGGLVVG